MLKQLHIKLTARLKKQETSNKFISGLVNVILIVLYPLVLLIGLVTMFFAALISFYQKIFTTKAHVRIVENTKSSVEHWSIMTERDNLKILSSYAGEVRFGPVYLNLKSEPLIPFLGSKVFGEWIFYRDNILFLQKWNSTNKPNTDLVAIDTLTFEIKVIQQNIPSVLWDIVETENGNLRLTCDTGYEILKYSIN